MTGTGKTVYTYTITRTRLVTERFRVTVDAHGDESEQDNEVQITLADEMELPQKTEHCELLEVETKHTEIEYDSIEREDY